jgi:hypothetical protein
MRGIQHIHARRHNYEVSLLQFQFEETMDLSKNVPQQISKTERLIGRVQAETTIKPYWQTEHSGTCL